nr:recombinase family protein [uncultured Oscillibacter sp.]
MSERLFGYARVSTREQKEDRQVAALRSFGVEENRIVVEKRSGKDFQRPLYQRLGSRLRPGDVLVVKSIDRLGRNYDEILSQWALLTRERRVAVVVLDMPLLDTREGRDLTGTLVADIVLQLLSYVAQTEREFLRQRQAEGIAAAREKGVRFGRRPLPVPERFDAVARRWRDGEISAVQAGKELGLSRHTFTRRTRELYCHGGVNVI